VSVVGQVLKGTRELLEMHCYVHTHHLAKYQYILTNNKTRFGDFHALMPALFGKAAHDPDAYLKKLKNEAKELDMESQAQWPRFWSALQDFRAEMPEVELAGGCKKIKPLTDDEIFDIVLERSTRSRWVPPVGGAPSRHTGTGGATAGVHAQCLRDSGAGDTSLVVPRAAARQSLVVPREAARRSQVVPQSKQLGSQTRRCRAEQAAGQVARRGDAKAAEEMRGPASGRAQEGRRGAPRQDQRVLEQK